MDFTFDVLHWRDRSAVPSPHPLPTTSSHLTSLDDHRPQVLCPQIFLPQVQRWPPTPGGGDQIDGPAQAVHRRPPPASPPPLPPSPSPSPSPSLRPLPERRLNLDVRQTLQQHRRPRVPSSVSPTILDRLDPGARAALAALVQVTRTTKATTASSRLVTQGSAAVAAAQGHPSFPFSPTAQSSSTRYPGSSA
ncbi:hypothetical protein BDA96_04G385900 [Sorghum bicolor]|uniref:Uncharacterized protein n=1 Tax=Sorghum bicolor TaxID=4558 RepID=A0A921RAD9_SORBI|nr:hypothetical protein BDA96_04G385900 [Sorghum bicolor]